MMNRITNCWKRLAGIAGLLAVFLGFAVPQQALAGDLERTAEHLMIQNILRSAGVLEIIYQVPRWIEQEMDNLEATPVPFDGKELQSVRQDLENAFSTSTLKDRLKERLASQFTLEELTALNDIFKQPDVKQFHDLQEGAQNDYIKADIRSYKAKLKNLTPRGSRVEMVKTLEDNLKHSQLERDLKVELRKSLLTSVSWVKSNELLEEGVLEKELRDYRERVGEELNHNALIFYLYLFKRTPSEKLSSLVASFETPEYAKFMAICHEEMLSSIKESRRKIPDNINLAEKQ